MGSTNLTEGLEQQRGMVCFGDSPHIIEEKIYIGGVENRLKINQSKVLIKIVFLKPYSTWLFIEMALKRMKYTYFIYEYKCDFSKYNLPNQTLKGCI